VFKFLNIPVDLVEIGLKALEFDSQNGTIVKDKPKKLSTQQLQEADNILKLMETPLSTNMTVEEFNNIVSL